LIPKTSPLPPKSIFTYFFALLLLWLLGDYLG
jgi:hypothetical protein